ncbi:MAG: hypothetical protein H7A30_06995 [Thermotogae bacterium]|nr:hypothetical protein [Thermotogota bacterium]
MKRFLLLLSLTLFFISGFSLTTLNQINFSEDYTYAATQINSIMEDYDVVVGNKISEIDVKLALKQLQNLGIYSSYDYSLDENSGVLNITVNANPLISKVVTVTEGEELLKKDLIDETLSGITLNMPLNTKEFQTVIASIQNLFNANGYQFVDISTNIKLDSNTISLDTVTDKKNTYKDNVLVFFIKPYSLWDITLKDDYAKLDKEALKKRITFNFRKDYNAKFFLLRPNIKTTYPSSDNLQAIITSLGKLPYFGPETQLNFEQTDIEDNVGLELNLVISGKMPKLTEDTFTVSKINISGNYSLPLYRIEDYVKKSITENATADNLSLLKTIDNLKELYTEEEYFSDFIDIQAEKSENDVNISINERAYGKVNVTQAATAKTRDYITNSFINITEGSVLKQKPLYNTYSSFMGSGFYKNVNIYPVSMNATSVDFAVIPDENDKPGKFLGGLTWSLPENDPWYYGFSGTLNVDWPNPFGMGQTYGIDLQLTPLSNYYVAGFNYKIIQAFKTNINFGTDLKYAYSPDGIYNETLNSTVLNQFTVKVSPSVKFSDFSYITNYISYENYILQTNEKLSKMSASLGYLYNALDSPTRPYNGNYFSVSGFGGFNVESLSKYYAGENLEYKFFKSFEKFTVGAHAKVGYAVDTGDLWNYSTGGIFSVRGYDYNSKLGDKTWLANAELIYELYKGPSFSSDLYLFADAGNSEDNYENLMNSPLVSFGAGLKVTLPFLGQIRFDFPYILENNQFKFRGLTFAFGQVF